MIVYFEVKPHESVSHKENKKFIFIGLGAFLVHFSIFMITLIAYKCARCSKEQSDPSVSSFEMIEETVQGTDTGTVTVDNLLWTTSAADENNQDLFQNDFESDVEAVFFYASESDRSNDENDDKKQ